MHFEIIRLNKKNISDFAKERNTLLQNSKTDWVLFLDSDEEISPEFRKVIERLDPSDYKGFYILRKNYFLGQFIGTDKILRLGKRNSGKWERRVHETWNIKGKAGQLKVFVVHQTAKSLSEYLNKINFYSLIHAEENLKEGKKSGLFKIIFFPLFKFLQSLLMGRGFVFSMLQSFHSFLAWSKVWQLQNA